MGHKITIAIPFHWMENWDYFLTRCLKSIESQTFKDYEVVLIKHGSMPETSNCAIESATGELIKILYMDDMFAHENALQEIVDNFKDEDHWLVTGCVHQRTEKDYYEDPHSPHYPTYNEKIYTGANTIGSPSVLTIRNEGHLLFDHNLSWLLDCDLYHRYYQQYGAPKIINDLNVVIGIGAHQTTHILEDKQKNYEYKYLLQKHE